MSTFEDFWLLIEIALQSYPENAIVHESAGFYLYIINVFVSLALGTEGFQWLERWGEELAVPPSVFGAPKVKIQATFP